MNKYYQVIPVEQGLPTERDLYICGILGKGDGIKSFHYAFLDFCAGSFGTMSLKENETVTEWLKPIEEGEVFSKEDMEREAVSYGHWLLLRSFPDLVPEEAPDNAKQLYDTYLKSLKIPL